MVEKKRPFTKAQTIHVAVHDEELPPNLTVQHYKIKKLPFRVFRHFLSYIRIFFSPIA